MTEELAKGTHIPLSATAVRAVIRWSLGAVPDVDASALLLGADDKVRNDTDFVFYNQPTHPSHLVKRRAKTRGPEGRTDSIDIDLARLPADVRRVVIAASTDGGTFGKVSGLAVLLFDLNDAVVNGTDPNRALARFVVPGATVETALLCGELYRRAGTWRFRAIGQGYDSGLIGLATDFGIRIDDPEEEEARPSEPARQPSSGSAPPEPAENRRRAEPVAATPAGNPARQEPPPDPSPSPVTAAPPAEPPAFALPPQGPQFQPHRR
ncbi:hypothetical protein BIV57_05320 [Mangrovactinospora gilvigrisea]|uniref:TerD domain-containing protein n=1 Tax=Mangrovactinospora gilvigrisea TaxID=1428644 RepID=A0A1J7CAG5_9ACTN|nr:TerD family protein [Mangrovactinospora gilvigrisea]OIV38504.1 hypothetical protein BIV57_05320 [Mangrovactinospora gilvigrisea]